MLVLLCTFVTSVCPDSGDFQQDGSYIVSARDPTTGKEVDLIAEKQFQGCSNLGHVVISEGITIIGSYAFEGSSVSAVTFPTTLVEIRQSAFRSAKLTAVSLPDSVTKLGYHSFLNCTALRTVIIGAGCVSILDGAFWYLPVDVSITIDSNNPRYECVNGIITTKDDPAAVVHVVDKFTDYVLPTDKLYAAKTHSFAGMTKMVTFTGITLLNLPGYAFRWNSALINITLGPNVDSVSDLAFNDCSIRNIFVDPANPYLCDIDGVLYRKNGTFMNIAQFPPGKQSSSTFNIPKTMNSITCVPFAGTSIATFTADSDHPVFKIHNGIVYSANLDALLAVPPKYTASTLSILSGVKVIGPFAMRSQLTVTKVDVPDGVVELGYSAFQLSKIREINLPETLEIIGAYAFHGIYVDYLCIPGRVTTLVSAACHWSGVKNVEITAPVTVIEQSAFQYCQSMQTFVFPSTLESIGDRAFLSCTSLEKLVFPESLKHIGTSAFEECTALRGNIIIPMYVKNIGNRAFYLAAKIETITIMNCNTIIGSQAFHTSTGVIQHICVMSMTFTADGVFAFRDRVRVMISVWHNLYTVSAFCSGE